MAVAARDLSWTRLADYRQAAQQVGAAGDIDTLLAECSARGQTVLGNGCGRSYSDVGLNKSGIVLRSGRLDNFLSADWTSGLVHVEAGLTLDELLRVSVPKGWFLPVTPGTKFVSVAGAIANDVHGKNHHKVGNFGNFVRSIVVHRSDRGRLVCTPQIEPELFSATIGGLGLTGFIASAEIALLPIKSSFLSVENIRFNTLSDYYELAEESNDWAYTVAWIDGLASGSKLGRGIFSRARHSTEGELTVHGAKSGFSIPIDAPSLLLNTASMRLFNAAYFAKAGARSTGRIHYDPFFYPLDGIRAWNRLYGRNGFYQYQCVVPTRDLLQVSEDLLTATTRTGTGSFLTVLKSFGAVPSAGLMSFPMEGATFALDFANRGPATLKLFSDLDSIVRSAGGRLYPAKDARMPADMFHSSYPQWKALEEIRDPIFQSSFWDRVTGDKP